MDRPAFKILGNINIEYSVKKINDIFEKGWKDYCYDPGPPFNEMNKIQCLDMIILFSLPEKHNIVLQNLIYNKELLNIFKDEIQEVSDIFDQYYFNKQPKRITLNNMSPNSIIPEHKDFMYHYENTIKVHVPIMTNDNVIFKFPSVNQSLHMKTGEIVEFNNTILHSASNKSEQNRVHLIIDYGEKDDPYYGEVDYDWNNYL